MYPFQKNTETLCKEELASILKTSPEALEKFEEQYAVAELEYAKKSNNLFDHSIQQIKRKIRKITTHQELIDKIVDELVAQTVVEHYGKEYSITKFDVPEETPVTPDDLKEFDQFNRPNLLGRFMQRDTSGNAYPLLLELYQKFQNEGDLHTYQIFRQGLDICDLDPIVYEILGMNKNTIGYWLPHLQYAVSHMDSLSEIHFLIPETDVIKVPITLLQLSRLEYESLSPITMKILDQYCMKVFSLDPKKEYFVKTGTFSSKFNFRNAHVKGEKEVEELGEYLLYISHQASIMAGPLTIPCTYGVSTTNEWCVREYIQDKENNPCIYHGMPLHTEYRVFFDGSTKEILGIAPYWKPDVMKKRFEGCKNPNEIHDYAIYLAHEETLMKRYNENKTKILKSVEYLLKNMQLDGQWSLDIMQNGDEFYLIDMALAQNSALNDCCSKGLPELKEDWIPNINE